ncbi:hypothetical protein ACSBR2_022652 [Camellia fascicularis]
MVKRCRSNTGLWSSEEEEPLQKLLQRHGAWNWSLISKSILTRSVKSCRRSGVIIFCQKWSIVQRHSAQSSPAQSMKSLT